MSIHPGALLFSIFAALPVISATPSPQPTLLSSFPLGGAAGSDLTVAVRGENLAGAVQVLFDCSDIRAQVKGVEDIKPEPADPKDQSAPEKPPKKLQSVSLEMTISSAAQAGAHTSITPRSLNLASQLAHAIPQL